MNCKTLLRFGGADRRGMEQPRDATRHHSKEFASPQWALQGREDGVLLIILILLIIGFGYGGYRVGPGWGYYGGGSVSLLLTIVLILLLLRVI
jgi:Protein of unknown function (DUF3309)